MIAQDGAKIQGLPPPKTEVCSDSCVYSAGPAEVAAANRDWMARSKCLLEPYRSGPFRMRWFGLLAANATEKASIGDTL